LGEVNNKVLERKYWTDRDNQYIWDWKDEKNGEI
jgi:hypothetical protein